MGFYVNFKKFPKTGWQKARKERVARAEKEEKEFNESWAKNPDLQKVRNFREQEKINDLAKFGLSPPPLSNVQFSKNITDAEEEIGKKLGNKNWNKVEIEDKKEDKIENSEGSWFEDLEEKPVYSIMNSGKIELADKKDLSEFKKELLRVGKWQYKDREGILDITKEMLKDIVRNFKAKVIDNVFVPLGHPTADDPSKNVGEVAGLELIEGGSKLIARIDIKDKSIVQKIKKGIIKGISASFVRNYVRKDTGKKVGTTLFHTALVNEPFIKGMAGFVPLSDDFKDSIVVPFVNTPIRMSETEEDFELSEEDKKGMENLLKILKEGKKLEMIPMSVKAINLSVN